MDKKSKRLEEFRRNVQNLVWDGVEEDLENSRGLKVFGFESRHSVRQIWIILVGGDLVHPIDGPNYVASLQAKRDHDLLRRATNKRDWLVKKMVGSIVEHIKVGELAEANEIANSPHKVIYICRTQEETMEAMISMNERGFFVSSIVDTDLQAYKDGLIFVFGEEYSYF